MPAPRGLHSQEVSMIDLFSDADELLTFAQAAVVLPSRRQGKKVSISTLWRWATRGSRGVVLETKKLGGLTYTSREALTRFWDARSLTPDTRQAPMPSPSKACLRAIEELHRRGI